MALETGTLIGSGAESIDALFLTNRQTTLRLDIAKIRIALFTLAHLGFFAHTIRTKAGTNGITFIDRAQSKVIAGPACTLIGRRTHSILTRLLANGYTTLLCVIHPVAFVADTFPIVITVTVAAIDALLTLGNTLGGTPRQKVVAIIACTDIGIRTLAIYTGFRTDRFTYCHIRQICVATLAETYIGSYTTASSTIHTFRHTVTGNT